MKTNPGSLLTRMSTIRRTKTTSRSPARDSNKNKVKMSNFSSDNLSHSCEESLVSSQRNSDNSIPIQKRNSDVNFLLEEEDEGVITALTSRHKGAIRAIRKLKYLVAKRKFKEALKPYDIKDVIESYSAGHSDLVFKVKGLQSRLDLILGRPGSKGKDVYESKTSLASRIVNVERMVDSIEEKLQCFMELYQEDRKRFVTAPAGGSEGHVPGPGPGQPALDNEANLKSFDDCNEEEEERSEEADTPPSHTSATFASIAQGLELFSIVSEQKQNALGFTPTVNAYNV